MKTEEELLQLRTARFAEQIRLETIKELVSLGFGHIGGCMSICELLAVLYSGGMRRWGEAGGDIFICSKGHAGPAVYAALALSGSMPLSMLNELNRPGTRLPSHCDRRLTPGVDMTTGSLGQGLSVGVGAALGRRLDGLDSRVYVLIGDGEAQEGQIWEAAMAASQYGLSNLVAFIDYNKYQINGAVNEVNDICNFAERFASFRWSTLSVNGHDVGAVRSAIEDARSSKRPTAIILDTVKGYGCKYALEQPRCHSLNMPADKLQESIALTKERIAAYSRALEGGENS